MKDVTIFKSSSDKPFDTFITDLTKEIEAKGFSVPHQEKSNLVDFYQNAGFTLPTNYRHVMLQVCKPEVSSKSLNANPERSVFVQKFIFVYTKGEKTEIRFLCYSNELIAELLGHNEFADAPSDDDFANRMTSAFMAMEAAINAAV